MSKSAVFFSITHIEKYAKTIHLRLDTLLRGPNTPYVVCLIAGAVVTVLKTRLLSKLFPDLPLQLSSIFKT